MAKQMRIAVTGGSGRIGSAVVRELLSRGHMVINIDRRQAAEPIATRFVYADLARREQIQPVLEQVDAVCHLGEIANVHVGFSPEHVLAENVTIGSTVLQTAADLKLSRAIYTSTCQVYGLWEAPKNPIPPKYLPIDEAHPIAPHNAYALSKATNEAYAQLAARQQGMSVAVFRLPWCVPWEYTPAWEAQLRERPTSTDGFATYCHVSDVARAYALAIESDRAGCEIYHLSAAEIMSLYPLTDRLREHHPEYPPLPGGWPAFASPLLARKAKDHFGWEPRWNLLDFHRLRHGEIRPQA